MNNEINKKVRGQFQQVDITIALAKRLVAKAKKYIVSDLMPGLCFKVEPSGHKSWIYYYRAKGRGSRSMKLGDFETTSPTKARDLVKKISQDLLLGKDPQDGREELRAENNLEEALIDWTSNHLTVSNGYRKKTIDGIKSIFKAWIFRKSNDPAVREKYNGLIDLRYKKISVINHDHAIQLLKHVGSKSPTTANRLVQYLRLAFNHFQKKKLNPFKMTKKNLYKEHEYDDYLSIIEFERVLSNVLVVDSRNGLLKRSHYKDNKLSPVTCLLIAFRLVTGRRSESEANNLMWSMVRDDRIILKETKTSKYNTPLTFFLSDKAKEILQVIRKERLQRYEDGDKHKDWFRNRFVFNINDKRNNYIFPSRDFNKIIANGKKGTTPFIRDTRSTWQVWLPLLLLLSFKCKV